MIFQVTKRFYPIRVWLLKKHSDAQKKKKLCVRRQHQRISQKRPLLEFYMIGAHASSILYTDSKNKNFSSIR